LRTGRNARNVKKQSKRGHICAENVLYDRCLDLSTRVPSELSIIPLFGETVARINDVPGAALRMGRSNDFQGHFSIPFPLGNVNAAVGIEREIRIDGPADSYGLATHRFQHNDCTPDTLLSIFGQTLSQITPKQPFVPSSGKGMQGVLFVHQKNP
jgi:hypothetical protein